MADFFRARLTELIAAKMKSDDKLRNLSEKIAKVQRQLNEQRDMYNRNTSEILVTVQADAATAVGTWFELCGGKCRLESRLRLRAVDTKSPIQLAYKASVYQSTGEWNNVHFGASTANPNLGGLKPELVASGIWSFISRL